MKKKVWFEKTPAKLPCLFHKPPYLPDLRVIEGEGDLEEIEILKESIDNVGSQKNNSKYWH